MSARVLIVDDMPDMRAVMGAHLRSDGYDVLEAADGAKALDIAIREQPDLVLMDVLMPGSSGFDVCRQMKAHPATRLTPVILVTSLEDADSKVSGFEADADEFVTKPIHRQELLARTRAILRLRAAIRDKESAMVALEAEKQEHLKKLFGRYMSPSVVDHLMELSQNERDNVMEQSTRIECTVMFTDIRGFTAMSEALQPAQVVGILNEHFTDLTTVAHRNGASVLNMTGDGLLLAFGAPLPHATPELSAVKTALEMQRDFDKIRERVKQEHGLTIGLGIGINSGPLIAGNVGSENYMSFTVIGDAVNVAARVQAAAPPGVTIVTDSVWRAAQGELYRVDHDPISIPLKGKTSDQQLVKVVSIPREQP